MGLSDHLPCALVMCFGDKLYLLIGKRPPLSNPIAALSSEARDYALPKLDQQ